MHDCTHISEMGVHNDAFFNNLVWIQFCTYNSHCNTFFFIKIGKFLDLQMKSEYIYEIIDFPKYHRKSFIDFCPENLFRLGMLCTHLSRVNLRIIKTNHMYLVYKTFQGRNLSNFWVVFWKIDDFTNIF